MTDPASAFIKAHRLPAHQHFPEESIARRARIIRLGLEAVENSCRSCPVRQLHHRAGCSAAKITSRVSRSDDVRGPSTSPTRGRFYDNTGAIRDVIQNHMLQVLATGAGRAPDGSGLAYWRDVKFQIIGALEPLSPQTTVRGQYEGYLQVPGVAPGSTTETYAAIRLTAQSWRWADVPIVIRAGKCLPVTATEVVLRFRKPPHDVFGVGDQADANNLRVRIYPDDRVGITVLGKKPGPDMAAQPRELAYSGQTMQQMMRPYDRLIGAALSGDRYLFARQETVEAAWRVVQPELGDVVPVVPYPRDTWGPAAADSLLAAGETWHNPAP